MTKVSFRTNPESVEHAVLLQRAREAVRSDKRRMRVGLHPHIRLRSMSIRVAQVPVPTYTVRICTHGTIIYVSLEPLWFVYLSVY